jgi:hypothetical protein
VDRGWFHSGLVSGVGVGSEVVGTRATQFYFSKQVHHSSVWSSNRKNVRF